MLIEVFARREPTQCHTAKAIEKLHPGATRKLTDIAVYRDAGCSEPFGRYGPDLSSRPRKNTKVITLNCWKWKLTWLPELKPSTA